MTVMRKPSRAPFTELALLQREINQLFERLAEFDRTDSPAAGEWCPSIDVFECHGQLMIVVEVPGLTPESVRVACKDHSLLISGDRRERRPGGSAAYLCMERPQGRFTRKIPLDMAVDLRMAEAQLENGLLTITVPRLKDRRGRETVIPVKRDRGD
jgi:HSP20 family protein